MKNLPKSLEWMEAIVFQKTGRSLSSLEKTILHELVIDPKKTYEQIATQYGYSSEYLQKRIGPSLWQLLSQAFNRKITKTNFITLLIETYLELGLSFETLRPEFSAQPSLIELPDGQIPLGSKFYIERPPLEASCYQEITQPRALIRIKAPRKMGKTSLMVRILAHAQTCHYATVRLSLNQAGLQTFQSVADLLRWFCANVTHQLGLQSALDTYWDEDMGGLVSCTLYLEQYLLPAIQKPLVIAIDEFNRLFEYPKIVADFLAILRFWREETTDVSIWQNLRLILVYLTDRYVSLKIKHLSFSVGLVHEIPPLNSRQVGQLIQQYGIAEKLDYKWYLDWLGGIPYLIQLSLYYGVSQGQSPAQIQQMIATHPDLIYGSYLQELWWELQQDMDLLETLQSVLTTTQFSRLKASQIFQLVSLGLIRLQGNTVTMSCQLYQQYFCDRI